MAKAPRGSTRQSARQAQKEEKKSAKQPEKVQEPQKEEKEEKEVKKLQPISKPKQYKNKSIDAKQRIARSKTQKIFLMSANRLNDSSWNFSVEGTSGSQYYVWVSTSVSCTCMDFRLKKKPCKHIYFIVTQVAQNDEILNYFRGSTTTISKAAYDVLDEQLTSRLKARLQGDKKDKDDIDLKDDTDCTICFTEMEKETEDLTDCGTCKKYFHDQCLAAWKARNPSCPLCRSPFSLKLTGGEKGDAMSKLVRLNV